MPRYDHRGAFTLIELLVVISIITLLIGILLPALAAARETAKSAACLSNERQIGQLFFVYANDYDGLLPPFDHSGAIANSATEPPNNGSAFPVSPAAIRKTHADRTNF